MTDIFVVNTKFNIWSSLSTTALVGIASLPERNAYSQQIG
ncbi:hypothetical protein JV46_09330 [Solemya velum gill symbiont]|uniref:Uncharacterized protein n=1 Tax=Solemya velum gill symbiont TaxID=2340 RepID=A0A0B0H321_SOVGS|nr:hypothetical protein JV46_09330 [Solemya velum gill symbiont]